MTTWKMNVMLRKKPNQEFGLHGKRCTPFSWWKMQYDAHKLIKHKQKFIFSIFNRTEYKIKWHLNRCIVPWNPLQQNQCKVTANNLFFSWNRFFFISKIIFDVFYENIHLVKIMAVLFFRCIWHQNQFHLLQLFSMLEILKTETLRNRTKGIKSVRKR